jgi:hypothetical protein
MTISTLPPVRALLLTLELWENYGLDFTKDWNEGQQKGSDEEAYRLEKGLEEGIDRDLEARLSEESEEIDLEGSSEEGSDGGVRLP